MQRLYNLCLYDAVLSSAAPYNLDDVDAVMSQIHEVKYEQPKELNIDEEGRDKVEVRCYASGRSLGGAVWRVAQESQSLNLLYASDVLHRTERFLDGIDFKRIGKSPTLLIQDALGVSLLGSHHQPPPKIRDGQMLERVIATLRAGGDVLIPVDSTSRVLEVLLLLDEKWQREMLEKAYDLIFYTQISSIFDIASSHVEWCSRQLQNQLDQAHMGGGVGGNRQNDMARDPFRVVKVVIADTFDKVFSSRKPRVVVCAGVELSRRTPAREVFLQRIASNPLSCVLFVLPSLLPHSVSSQLMAGSRLITMNEEQRVELEGEERIAWETEVRTKAEDRERERVAEMEMEKFEQEDDDENADGGGNVVDGLQAMTTTAGEDGHSTLARLPSVGTTQQQHQHQPHEDALGVALPPQLVFAMSKDNMMKWDEYGGFVNLEELMDEEALLLQRSTTTTTASSDATANATATATTPTITQVDEQAKAEKEALLARIANNMASNTTNSIGGGQGNESAPTKTIPITVQVQVACKIHFIDFSGRAGATDLFEIVNLIKPKKLIVVRAGQVESEKFASECQEKTACVVGLAPATSECLDIAAHSSVVRVRVPEETLAMSPDPVRVGDMTLQRVRAKMILRSLQGGQTAAAAAALLDKQKKLKMAIAGGELPSILPLDPGTRLVGDGDCWWISPSEPNLDHIMRKLKEKGVKCHLGAHGERVLLCGEFDDVVLWKPPGEGRIMVSGPLCDTYFVVRRYVYDLFGLV